jgi:dimeric dUTPase (all-alpha-NTP-PPase superfamily)
MEASEAIDSFNWKHWKDINTEPDWENIKVELVDIWHFIMSELIRLNDEDYAYKYLSTKTSEDLNELALIEVFEKIISISVTNTKCDDIYAIREVSDLFFVALSHVGIDTEDLYRRYVVKNQLNSFRQNHGYKNGSYIKLWGKVEDNVVAFNIMDKYPNISPSDLYQKLELEYSHLD